MQLCQSRLENQTDGNIPQFITLMLQEDSIHGDLDRLTEYCRAEFEKFTTFLTSKKVPKLASFRVKLVNFPSEKGRFGFCYDRYTSAVFG